jgi:hypothetical protein
MPIFNKERHEKQFANCRQKFCRAIAVTRDRCHISSPAKGVLSLRLNKHPGPDGFVDALISGDDGLIPVRPLSGFFSIFHGAYLPAAQMSLHIA